MGNIKKEVSLKIEKIENELRKTVWNLYKSLSDELFTSKHFYDNKNKFSRGTNEYEITIEPVDDVYKFSLNFENLKSLNKVEFYIDNKYNNLIMNNFKFIGSNDKSILSDIDFVYKNITRIINQYLRILTAETLTYIPLERTTG